MSYVLCTGNMCTKEQYTMLQNLSPNFLVVKGDYDDIDDLPSEQITNIEGYKVGLTHGDEILPNGNITLLTTKARKMGVDILVVGHSHVPMVQIVDDVLILNPGSGTGASNCTVENVVPSFMLLDFKPENVTVFHYQLSGKLSVNKTVYSKLK